MDGNNNVTMNAPVQNFAPQPQKPKKNKKKTLLLIIVVIVAVMLVNSIKSAMSPVGKVERLIKNIEIVSMDDDASLIEAEEAYANLGDYEKSQVENADALLNARTNFDNLKATYNAIEAIGEVTLASESKIKTAREKFDACDEASKELITNKDVLIAAEEKISEIKVNNAIAEINKIGKVTIDSKTKIENAKAAYDKLSDAEKGKVTNAATLTKATADFEKIMKTEGAKKAKNAFAVLKKEHDKVQGITWYEPKARPYYADTRSYILPYIGMQNGNAWLRLAYWYTGDDWIFFESVTVMVDGKKYYEIFGPFGTERDNDNGYVWEYVDKEADATDIEMLKAIANSKETIVRFQGDNYHYDLTVSASDKKAIKEVLTAYEYADYLE